MSPFCQWPRKGWRKIRTHQQQCSFQDFLETISVLMALIFFKKKKKKKKFSFSLIFLISEWLRIPVLISSEDYIYLSVAARTLSYADNLLLSYVATREGSVPARPPPLSRRARAGPFQRSCERRSFHCHQERCTLH